MADSVVPLSGEARLLGTSASLAFLYWPGTRRIEAVTIGSIARIQALPRRPRSGTAPAVRR